VVEFGSFSPSIFFLPPFSLSAKIKKLAGKIRAGKSQVGKF
jgi:hypothetical protein